MEEKYIELLAKTDYNALTSDEKELIKELCTNQSEFEQAKQLMNELNALDHAGISSGELIRRIRNFD